MPNFTVEMVSLTLIPGTTSGTPKIVPGSVRLLALLVGPAVAQQQTFRNERGQITGSASTSGNVTTYRDRSGRMTGTAERMRD